MAFSITGPLICLTPHGRDEAKIWHYETTDASTTVDTSGYFNSVSHLLGVNDLIYVKCSDGYGFIIVNANSAGVVDCNDMVPLGGIPQKIYLWGRLADVSTASAIYLVAPVAGSISRITTVLQGAITVANAAVKASIGGVDITGGGVTVAYSGSAAGDMDTSACTAANTVTERQVVKIETDGGSTDTAALEICLELTPASPSTDTD